MYCTSLEEYTSQDKWMGGFTDKDGKHVFSAEQVSNLLKTNGFELLEEFDMPFLIREHRRKYQWGCSHASMWRKL